MEKIIISILNFIVNGKPKKNIKDANTKIDKFFEVFCIELIEFTILVLKFLYKQSTKKKK